MSPQQRVITWLVVGNILSLVTALCALAVAVRAPAVAGSGSGDALNERRIDRLEHWIAYLRYEVTDVMLMTYSRLGLANTPDEWTDPLDYPPPPRASYSERTPLKPLPR